MLVELRTDCGFIVSIKTITQSVYVEKGDISLGHHVNSGVN